LLIIGHRVAKPSPACANLVQSGFRNTPQNIRPANLEASKYCVQPSSMQMRIGSDQVEGAM
jgi:hypothetical protein